MKYVLIIGDGIADQPLDVLGGKTPLAALDCEGINRLAGGRLGLCQTVPAGVAPGSDTAILSIFGYDPRTCYTGRSALEAAGMGVFLAPGETSFRVNLCAIEGDSFETAKILSHNGGSIEGEEAVTLMEDLVRDPRFAALAAPLGFSIHITPTFRHTGVIDAAHEPAGEMKFTEPHNILGSDIAAYMPKETLGDELTAVVESIINGTNYQDPEKSVMRIGVDVLPAIPKDTTDRNRTSPLAFTGNKFEFRMVGSSQSVAGPNIALNTIMAEELSRFADELEQAEDFDSALQSLVCRTFTEHSRIIFNGNGYSESWQKEAERLGLSNYRSTAEAMPHYISEKNIELVTKHGIFTEAEFRARHEIHLEAYCKLMRIEAQTTVDMAMRQILPAVSKYCGDLCARADLKQRLFVTRVAELDLITRLSEGIDQLYSACEDLKKALQDVPTDSMQGTDYYHSIITPAMAKVRSLADSLELLTDKTYWPYPAYSDLLFY